MIFEDELRFNKGNGLRDLLHEVWLARWMTLAVAAIATILGFVYVLYGPQVKVANLLVLPAPQAEMLKYQQMNATETSFPSTFKVDAPPTTFFFDVQADGLVKLLFEDLIAGNTVRKAIEKRLPAALTDEQREQAVDDELANYRFLRPSAPSEIVSRRDPQVNTDWLVKYEGPGTISVRAVLGEAMAASVGNVAQVLQEQFEQKISVAKAHRAALIESIDAEISNARQAYTARLKARLAFLDEQSLIARALGIAKSTIEVRSLDPASQIITNMGQAGGETAPYYLRGYMAIEEEAKALRGRASSDEYIPELVTLYSAIRQAEADKLVERATRAFNNSPIKSGKFVAAFYNVNSLKVSYKSPRSIVVASFLIGGLGIAFAIVFLIMVLKPEKPRPAKANLDDETKEVECRKSESWLSKQ